MFNYGDIWYVVNQMFVGLSLEVPEELGYSDALLQVSTSCCLLRSRVSCTSVSAAWLQLCLLRSL
jgi:hypothetical protein